MPPDASFIPRLVKRCFVRARSCDGKQQISVGQRVQSFAQFQHIGEKKKQKQKHATRVPTSPSMAKRCSHVFALQLQKTSGACRRSYTAWFIGDLFG